MFAYRNFNRPFSRILNVSDDARLVKRATTRAHAPNPRRFLNIADSGPSRVPGSRLAFRDETHFRSAMSRPYASNFPMASIALAQQMYVGDQDFIDRMQKKIEPACATLKEISQRRAVRWKSRFNIILIETKIAMQVWWRLREAGSIVSLLSPAR